MLTKEETSIIIYVNVNVFSALKQRKNMNFEC